MLSLLHSGGLKNTGIILEPHLLSKLGSLVNQPQNMCSIQNWVSDLFWKQLDLNYPDISDAMVRFNFKLLPSRH